MIANSIIQRRVLTDKTIQINGVCYRHANWKLGQLVSVPSSEEGRAALGIAPVLLDVPVAAGE